MLLIIASISNFGLVIFVGFAYIRKCYISLDHNAMLLGNYNATNTKSTDYDATDW